MTQKPNGNPPAPNSSLTKLVVPRATFSVVWWFREYVPEEHGCHTAVFWAQFQYKGTPEMYLMDERDIVIIELQKHFVRISCIKTSFVSPGTHSHGHHGHRKVRGHHGDRCHGDRPSGSPREQTRCSHIWKPPAGERHVELCCRCHGDHVKSR